MDIKPVNFVKKPFYVEAVRVTSENMTDVAKWCGGEIVDLEPNDVYILAPVLRPQNDRQKMAFVGDWLVKAGEGFKVYTDRALQKGFEISPEKPCGMTDGTADGQPCVLGLGHRDALYTSNACRSLQDYKSDRHYD